MYQIDNSTAATTHPAATSAGPAGFFTDGNPATGTPATIVPAEWLNAVMMELMNVVTGAGLTPSKGSYIQVLSAISAIATGQFTGANQSLAQTGYQRLPGGTLIQKGKVAIPASVYTGTFPLAFLDTSTVIVASEDNTSAAGHMNATVISATQFQLQSIAGTPVSDTANWIAIGRWA